MWLCQSTNSTAKDKNMQTIAKYKYVDSQIILFLNKFISCQFPTGKHPYSKYGVALYVDISDQIP